MKYIGSFISGAQTPTSFSGTRDSSLGTGYCQGYESNGIVTLDIAGASSNVIPIGQTLFTIPSAYRPKSAQYGVILLEGDSTHVSGRFNVNADGTITQNNTGQCKSFFGRAQYKLGGVARKALKTLQTLTLEAFRGGVAHEYIEQHFEIYRKQIRENARRLCNRCGSSFEFLRRQRGNVPESILSRTESGSLLRDNLSIWSRREDVMVSDQCNQHGLHDSDIQRRHSVSITRNEVDSHTIVGGVLRSKTLRHLQKIGGGVNECIKQHFEIYRKQIRDNTRRLCRSADCRRELIHRHPGYLPEEILEASGSGSVRLVRLNRWGNRIYSRLRKWANRDRLHASRLQRWIKYKTAWHQVDRYSIAVREGVAA